MGTLANISSLARWVRTLDAEIFPRRLTEWFNSSWKGLSSSLLVLLSPSVADYGSIQNSLSPSKRDRIVGLLAAFQCWLLQCPTWYALRARIDHKPLMHFTDSFRVLYFHLSLLPSTNTYWKHYAGDRHSDGNLFPVCLKLFIIMPLILIGENII